MRVLYGESRVPWVIYTARIMAFINLLCVSDNKNPMLT